MIFNQLELPSFLKSAFVTALITTSHLAHYNTYAQNEALYDKSSWITEIKDSCCSKSYCQYLIFLGIFPPERYLVTAEFISDTLTTGGDINLIFRTNPVDQSLTLFIMPTAYPSPASYLLSGKVIIRIFDNLLNTVDSHEIRIKHRQHHPQIVIKNSTQNPRNGFGTMPFIIRQDSLELLQPLQLEIIGIDDNFHVEWAIIHADRIEQDQNNEKYFTQTTGKKTVLHRLPRTFSEEHLDVVAYIRDPATDTRCYTSIEGKWNCEFSECRLMDVTPPPDVSLEFPDQIVCQGEDFWTPDLPRDIKDLMLNFIVPLYNVNNRQRGQIITSDGFPAEYAHGRWTLLWSTTGIYNYLNCSSGDDLGPVRCESDDIFTVRNAAFYRERLSLTHDARLTLVLSRFSKGEFDYSKLPPELREPTVVSAFNIYVVKPSHNRVLDIHKQLCKNISERILLPQIPKGDISWIIPNGVVKISDGAIQVSDFFEGDILGRVTGYECLDEVRLKITRYKPNDIILEQIRVINVCDASLKSDAVINLTMPEFGFKPQDIIWTPQTHVLQTSLTSVTIRASSLLEYDKNRQKLLFPAFTVKALDACGKEHTQHIIINHLPVLKRATFSWDYKKVIQGQSFTNAVNLDSNDFAYNWTFLPETEDETRVVNPIRPNLIQITSAQESGRYCVEVFDNGINPQSDCEDTDSAPCASSRTACFRVEVLKKHDGDKGGPPNGGCYCPGSPFVISAPSIPGATRYQWSPSQGLDNPSSQNTAGVIHNSTIYTWSAYSNDVLLSSGNIRLDVCSGDPVSFDMSVFPHRLCTAKTSISINMDKTGPARTPFPYRLNILEPSGQIKNLSSTGADIRYDFTIKGVYELTATDICGNTSGPVYVIVENDDPPSMPTPLGLCAGSTYVLTAPSGFVEYSWKPEELFSNPHGQETLIKMPGHDVDISLTVKFQSGCSIELIKPTRGKIKSYQPVNAVTQRLVVGCPGRTTHTHAYPVSKDPIKFVRWEDDKGRVISNTGHLAVDVFGEATYKYIVETVYGCRDEKTVTIKIPYPLNGAGPDLVICSPGQEVKLGLETDYEPGTAFLWEPPTGLSSANVPRPLARPSETTLYKLTVTSPNGCVITDEVQVSVGLTGFDPLRTVACKHENVAFEFLDSNEAGKFKVKTLTQDPRVSVVNDVIQVKTEESLVIPIEITSPEGCVALTSATVVILPELLSLDSPVEVTLCPHGNNILPTPRLYPEGFEFLEQGLEFKWTPEDVFTDSSTLRPMFKSPVPESGTVTLYVCNGCANRNYIFNYKTKTIGCDE